MEPVTLILVFGTIGVLGGVLISKIKKLHQAKYGEVESRRQITSPVGGEGDAQNANQCKVPYVPGSPASARPYAGDRPYAGQASVPTFQWMYVVKSGESPGSVAQAVTGDPKRYIELLSANSSRRMTSYRKGSGLSSSVEVNFAKDQFCEGDRLYVPKSWNPWIDEVGNFAGENGRTSPYPPYDTLPNYPIVDPSRITAGFVPWPPGNPTNWGAIPLPALPAPGVEP